MDQKTDNREEKQSTPAESQGPRNGKEKFYENFSGIPVKYLDIFIGICIAALILLIVVGVARGGKFL